MSIAIRNIDHVVLRVRDVPGMIRFYCDVVGCAEDRLRDDLGLYHLRAGTAFIDLVDVNGTLGKTGGAAPGADARNMDHLCLRVEPFNEAALRAHFTSHGVAVGELVTRYGAEGEGPSLYIQDPEGNTVELKGPANG